MMKIVILERAERHMNETAEYIRNEFGGKSEQKFRNDFNNVVKLLRRNPYLGSIEPLLSDRPTTFRSIVVAKLNKMVYRVMDDRIEIADFWDCRREPTALADRIN